MLFASEALIQSISAYFYSSKKGIVVPRKRSLLLLKLKHFFFVFVVSRNKSYIARNCQRKSLFESILNVLVVFALMR